MTIGVQVTVAVKDIEEGSHVRSLELKDPKDASRTMATLKVYSFSKPDQWSISGMNMGTGVMRLARIL